MILLMVLLMNGCNSKDNGSDTEDASKVDIYYIDTKSSEIVSESYLPQGTTKEQQIEELLKKLKGNPTDVLYKSALTDKVVVNNYSFTEDGDLTIDFALTYNDLTGYKETLCRAAIVKTLTQISGVEYIVFTINEQRLVDSSGNVVGFMNEEDFIDTIGSETDYQVKLYFANKAGDGLVEYSTDIYYNGTGTIEELVINKLINGPTATGMYDTIPEGTVLLDVNTKDGICYVDFNEKFLEQLTDISDDIPIYSIVNSLVELPNMKINKVQFKINGKVQESYRENIEFDGFFERNLELIEETK
ncbi:MAG: GerMN domain-containing protein, partial [Mobilitalea sp.]